MSLTRYDLETCDGDSGSCNAKLVEARRGDYVLYDEVVELLAGLKNEVENALGSFGA